MCQVERHAQELQQAVHAAHPGTQALEGLAFPTHHGGQQQLCAPVHVLGGKPDEQAVEIERVGDLGLEHVVEGLARHALDQLSHEPAVGEAVVAVGGARLVNGDSVGESLDHVAPVQHARGRIHQAPDVVEAGLVTQDLADRDPVLARLCELGPVLRHGIVVVDQAAIGEDVQQCRGHALRGGERERERLGLPGAALLVTGTRPAVDHRLAAVIDAQRRATGPVLRNLTLESLGRLLEIRVHVAAQHDRPLGDDVVRGDPKCNAF
jgi:hypothetical protein